MFPWNTGSEACERLCEVLTNTRLQNDVKKMSPKQQTSRLEAFHSLVNFFAPKLTVFSYEGMTCRYVQFKYKLWVRLIERPTDRQGQKKCLFPGNINPTKSDFPQRHAAGGGLSGDVPIILISREGRKFLGKKVPVLPSFSLHADRYTSSLLIWLLSSRKRCTGSLFNLKVGILKDQFRHYVCVSHLPTLSSWTL